MNRMPYEYCGRDYDLANKIIKGQGRARIAAMICDMLGVEIICSTNGPIIDCEFVVVTQERAERKAQQELESTR